MISGKKNSYLW